MTTLAIVLKKNKPKANGEYPLYLRITKNRKSKFISLKTYLQSDQWDEAKQKVKSKHPNSARLNHFLSQRITEAQSRILELETKDKSTTGKSIKQSIIGNRPQSFLKYLEDYKTSLGQNGNAGTYDKVNAVQLKLKTYLKGSELTFDEFDLEFLRNYEAYLRNNLGNSVNTVHSNLKIFRKLFNDAEREGIVEIQNNPFKAYKLSWKKVEKTFLTEDELKEIEAVLLKAGTKMELHRDLFVFACYAGGIRISDLLKMKWKNFDGTNLSFFTQKTKEHISIKLPNKALQIIQKYKTKASKPENLIFPLLPSDTNFENEHELLKYISSVTAYANKNLKIILSKTTIKKPISFHSSRHTWATRALKKGIPVTHVGKLMGHASLKTTMGYLKIVNKDLDEAMDLFND